MHHEFFYVSGIFLCWSRDPFQPILSLIQLDSVWNTLIYSIYIFKNSKTTSKLLWVWHEEVQSDGHLPWWSPAERTMACPKAISVSSPASDNTSRHVERRTVRVARTTAAATIKRFVRFRCRAWRRRRSHRLVRPHAPHPVCRRVTCPTCAIDQCRTAPIIAGLADAIAAAPSASAAAANCSVIERQRHGVPVHWSEAADRHRSNECASFIERSDHSPPDAEMGIDYSNPTQLQILHATVKRK